MFGTNRKVLSQKMHMSNMKALSHLFQKIIAKVKFT